MLLRRFIKLLAGLVFLSLITACQSDNQADIWPMVENCDLHQHSCTSTLDQAKATLSISPKPIPIAKPLDIDVSLQGLNPSKVELDISGLNMYMGYNRVSLQPSSEPGQFIGRSMLAFCTNEVMLWQVTIIAHQADGEIIQIPFQLETRNR